MSLQSTYTREVGQPAGEDFEWVLLSFYVCYLSVVCAVAVCGHSSMVQAQAQGRRGGLVHYTTCVECCGRRNEPAEMGGEKED